jgi:preprotein translocase subunit SecF
VLGAIALEDFSLALLVGLITGSYSSIFIATPILAMLKEGRQVGRTAEAARASRPRPAPATVPQPAGAEDTAPEPVSAAAASTPAAPRAPAGLGHAPRPRKKRRR